jgi:hypothetical protein
MAGAGDAYARASGGYSRPSVRTPSFSAPRSSPRSSGGYSRPSFPSVRTPSVPYSTASEGDRAFSRERSSQALDARRAQEDAARARQQTQPPPSGGWFGGTQDYRTPSTRAPGYAQPNYPQPRYTQPSYPQQQRPDWFARQGWQAPPYASIGPRRFGVWDGLFLWFMLDHLNRPGYGDFFRTHQSDPGYQQWRAQADQQATGDDALKGKLSELDRQFSEAAPPGTTAALPPDIPAEIAQADADKARTPTTAANDNTPHGPGFGTVVAVVLLGAAGVAFLAWRRRPHTVPSPSGAVPMTPLRTAAGMLRNAVSGQAYTPEHFRVGMTITADPTPFILAGGSTKVPAPDAPGGNMLLSVEAVGRVADGAASLVRLYLPGRHAMFQLHVDADGTPDECRYFGIIDQVTPADPNEWGAWLDSSEGMIGWPEFQTKDGQVYSRIWAPGPQRIAPRQFDEAIASAGAPETVRNQSMLYARPTGAAAPAPPTEYILVSALQRPGQAWVEIRAGIDVNPAALTLA